MVVVFGEQVFGVGDEVVEVVLFVFQFVGLVLGFVQFVVVMDMGDGKDEVVFEQVQVGVGELGIEVMFVGVVVIEIEWCGVFGGDVVEDFFVCYQVDWYLCVVVVVGLDVLVGVGVGVEGVFYWGLFEDGLCVIGEVQLVYLCWMVQGFVVQLYVGVVEFQVVLYVEVVGGVW